MKKNGFTVAGILLALAAASHTSTNGAEDKSGPATRGAGIPPSATAANERIADTICNYFERRSALPGEQDWACVPSDGSINSLVLTLPDPESTHLSLYTDRFVESVIRAASASQFFLSKYMLPWKSKPDKEIPGFNDRAMQQTESDNQRDEPGVMIFRRKDETLIVYVVPEEPTAGVNMKVLGRALTIIRRSDPFKDLRIVGPTFSGSLDGLAEYLDNHVPGACVSSNLKATLRSGSATALGSYKDFSKMFPCFDLHSTVEYDARALQLFNHYLSATWPQGKVELLSEDQTAYGAGFMLGSISYPRDIARLRNVYQDPAEVATGKDNVLPADPNRLALNNSFDSDNAFVHQDSPPAFAEKLSPASQQAAMMAITRTLREGQVSYVGVAATDVLDTLFLTSFLKRTNPNLRLFTLEADLLFERENENVPLTGLLSVTSYPLFRQSDSLSQRIPFPSRLSEGVYNATRSLLPGSTSEDLVEYSPPFDPKGARPALWLTVLGQDGYWPLALLDEPKSGDKKDRDKDDWMLLLSHPAAASADDAPELPSYPWKLAFWLLAALGFGHAWYVGRLLREKQAPSAAAPPPAAPTPQGDTKRRFRAALAGSKSSVDAALNKIAESIFRSYPQGRALSAQERTYLNAITLAALSATFVLASSAFRLVVSQGWYRQWTVRYMPAAVIAGGYLFIVAFRLSSTKFDEANKQYRWRILVPTWVLAASVLLGWTWLLTGVRLDKGICLDCFKAGYFAAYRSLHLTNGVSPAVPFLFIAAALVAWAWMQVHREDMMKRRQDTIESKATLDKTKPPEATGTPKCGGSAGGALQVCLTDIDTFVKDVFSVEIWAPALGWVALLVVFQWPFSTIRSLEGLPYDITLWVALFTLNWLVALSWVQFIRIWRGLSKLLQCLERHPLRNAFSRLEKKVDWVPLATRPTTTEHPYLITSRCIDVLRLLASFSRYDSAAVSTLNTLNTLYAKVEGDPDSGSDDDYTELQARLEQVREQLEQNLDEEWGRGNSESLNSEEQASISYPEQQRILAEEFIAYRYLVYIRYVFRHLRNLLGFVVTGFILAVAAVTVYPFQQERWLALTDVAALAVLGFGVVWVLAQIDRDRIISRITDTPAGRVGLTFYLRIVQFGVLPVITVVAAQFPSLNRLIASWLQPALNAFR